MYTYHADTNASGPPVKLHADTKEAETKGNQVGPPKPMRGIPMPHMHEVHEGGCGEAGAKRGGAGDLAAWRGRW